MTFINLQVITTNSLLKSTLTVEDLITEAKLQGHEAIALTDHNVLYGAIEFYELALKNNIKPLLGLTLDVQGFFNKEKEYPLILLAKNYKGYQDLIQLSTFYQFMKDRPLPIEEVVLRSDDVILISPSINGEISFLVKDGRVREAQEIANYLKQNVSIFYMGISLQGLEQSLLDFYKTCPYPLVALGNIQYLTPEEQLPSKVMRVLESDRPLGEAHQAEINYYLSHDEEDFSLRRPEVLYQSYKKLGLEEAALETKRIADNIHITIDTGQTLIPSFDVPKGETSDTYLKRLCLENLNKRVMNVNQVYYDRLDKELAVIASMGFSDYFLIVWDIMVYAHKQNIYTGSGRGSAAGSLVAYLLEITNADPIEYNLLFERFLNKERFTMPDIDLDFPDNRREEILQYIHQKYGHNNVAQIGTIGTYGAKSAVRDVNRVFGQSQEEIKRWAKAIPSGTDVTLESSLQHKTFHNLVYSNERNQQIFKVAKSLEGRNRHVSTHAAAVVISDYPLVQHVPLQTGSSELSLTQYTMESVEKVGLLKLDVLGLRNLSILSDCIRYIPFENNGKRINIDKIPFDDQQTLEIFRTGETDGVFQFESPGIRRVLRNLQPNSFEDIVAVNALYRPGPMEQIDTFIRRKNGKESIQYPHEDLKDILEVTYGVMVYQEQVMQVASKLAGYTLNEADILRRAISKKDHTAIAEGRTQFVNGALEKGYAKETALKVYGYIEQFADYGFNRSHAVAYSKVAYQLAYVKANYPASFFAAIMNASSKDKIKTFVAEAKQAGVKFLTPAINKSYGSFIVENKKIRFGLDIINGIPRNFIQEIIQERKNNASYKSLLDFLNRIDNKWLEENYILPLLYSGALDGVKDTRASMLYSLNSVLDSIKMSHGNTELFEIFAPAIEEMDELTDEEKMNQEFETTGYYFTAEPGEKYNFIRQDKQVRYIQHSEANQFIKILVVVEKISSIQTKKGEPMSFVDVVDNSGKATLTLFPNIHRRYIQKFDEGDTILVEGKVENKQTPIKIIVNNLTNAKEIKQPTTNENNKDTVVNTKQVLYIRFESLKAETKKLQALRELLKQFHGNTAVVLFDQETKQQKAFKKEYAVEWTDELEERLIKMFGHEHIMLKKL